MTRWKWDQVEHHVSVSSTNALALEDARPGRVVVADHQSAGQGRRGRGWETPPGTSLAVSAVVPALPAELMGWLPLANGLAVLDGLSGSRWPVHGSLKWPNDVLLPTPDGLRKVCGILCQVAPGGAIVVGTGLNIDQEADQLPVPTATSWRLARGGAPLPDGAREAWLEAYLARLAELHDALAAGDLGSVRAAYLERSCTVGTDVVVHLPDGTHRYGRAVDLDEDGALVVDGEGGRTVHHAGDVEHLRAR